MFERIPDEMKSYRQWVLWRLEDRGGMKPTKVPYNSGGFHADVTKASSWSTFEDVCQCGPWLAQSVVCNPDTSPLVTGFHGIGFVLTAADPYAFIDLDDTHGDAAAYERQIKVYREFDSYSEISPSGNGLHIIVKGELPHGRRRASIEVYTAERYMTMTGNVYNDKPIIARQELLTLLWEQMGGPVKLYSYGEDKEQIHTDEEIIKVASDALNGEKFSKLYDGDWQSLYPSQSEADFALVDIIAFYTQNRAQIARIFRASNLGQRDKANRDRYIAYMVDKSFDRQLPQVDIEGLRVQFQEMMANLAASAATAERVSSEPGSTLDTPASASGYAYSAAANPPTSIVSAAPDRPSTFPPGLVGDIAQFIRDAAPRPVPVIAYVGALGLMAGICGRAYNISATGLNLNLLLLAPTGTGKEAIANGIAKLMAFIRPSVAASADFIGPGEIASQQGLVKWLNSKPSVVSVVGEFGLKLKEMSSPTANVHVSSLKRLLLDLYNKSGAGNSLNPTAYSDVEKNTKTLFSPAFTLVGESTPERFYENLDESLIADGLLPRFNVIEYLGMRPKISRTHATAVPSFALVEKMAALTAHCLTLANNNMVQNVNMTAEAEAIFDAFNEHADAQINSTKAEVIRQLWNRAHIKALKVAALFAVGDNYINPLIVAPMAQRACNEIANQTDTLIERFTKGEVGSLETKQLNEVVKVIATFLWEPWERYKSYGGNEQMHTDGIVLADHIQRRTASLASFRNDRMGHSVAYKRALQRLLDNDDIREVPKSQLHMKYGKGSRAFVVANLERFRGAI